MPVSNNKPSPKKDSSYPRTPKDKGNEMVIEKELGAESHALSSNKPEPETIGLPQSTTALYRKTKIDQLMAAETEELKWAVRKLRDEFDKLEAQLEDERASAARDKATVFAWEVMAKVQTALYIVFYNDALDSNTTALRDAGIHSLGSFRAALSDDERNPAASAAAHRFVAEHYPASIKQLAQAVEEERRRLKEVPRPQHSIVHPRVNTKDLDDVLARFEIQVESVFLAKMKAAQDYYGHLLFE